MLMRAIELDSGNPYYANALGHVLAESGKPEQAKAHLETLLTSGTANADTHNELGVVYSILDQHEQAAKQFGEAARLMPLTALFHANLSHALRRLGRLHEAQQAEQAAIRAGFSLGARPLPIGTLTIPYGFE
jgi:tetratricopeptide (TPR) repeat protein